MAVKEPMDVDERYKLLRGLKPYYQRADRVMKGRLLDLLIEMTGQHRKYLIGQMNGPGPDRYDRTKERDRTYKEDVDRAVKVIGDALDWICAERMKPVLAQMARHLAKFNELETTPALMGQLETISVSTLRRRLHSLRPPEARLPRIHRKPRPENRVQAEVPIRIIPWDEPETGHFEVDLVQHGQPDPDRTLVYTIQFIDVLTGWSERFAMLGHTFDSMWHAFQRFRERCPLPILEVHTDNGSEFLNEALLASFHEVFTGSLFSRGEPGKCNHNRFVEQKNDTLVRAYLGNLSLDTRQQVTLLNKIYDDMWFYYNAFQPVMRQIAKTATRVENGPYRVVRTHDTPKTPLARLLTAKPPISRGVSQKLKSRYDETNPRALKHEIHAQLDRIHTLALENTRKEEAAR